MKDRDNTSEKIAIVGCGILVAIGAFLLIFKLILNILNLW